jgi:hemerythrin
VIAFTNHESEFFGRIVMTVIKWQEGYNTGVVQFDREHHKLVELIDIMYHAVRDKEGKETTQRACTELIAYTIYHFENEELAMSAANYPELEAHQEEHKRLKTEVEVLAQRLDTSFPEAASELYRFLRQWLINHIQDCDKRYGSYLKESGEVHSGS